MGLRSLIEGAEPAAKAIQQVTEATSGLAGELRSINAGPTASVSTSGSAGGPVGQNTSGGSRVDSTREAQTTNRLLEELVRQGRANGSRSTGSRLGRRAAGL